MQNRDDVNEVPNKYMMLGKYLRSFVDENSINSLRDGVKLEDYLKERNVANLLIVQTRLVLEESNVKNYFTQRESGISMIDVNNIVSCAERKTGLNKITVKNILTAILYGINLPTSIEKVAVQVDDSIVYNDKAIIAYDQYAEKEKEIDAALRKADHGNYDELIRLISDINRLAEAGVPKALYAKGKYYLSFDASREEHSKGYYYMRAAAKAGCIEANAFMGDYYFEASVPDFSTALKYYTEIGTVALSIRRQQNVRKILEAKPRNKKSLAITGIMVAVMFIFNFFMAQGKFEASADTHIVAGVVSCILILAAYVYGCIRYWKMKYNEIIWNPILIVTLFSICTFVALV